MKRVANFDITRRIESRPRRLATQVLFGLACALTMIGVRSVLDVWAATAGPFALVYPTVLLATLYGHWQAGLTAYSVSFFWAWYYVLTPVRSFRFEDGTDPSRVIINLVAVMVVLLFTEGFRRAVVFAIKERDVEIERREVLQQELEHRTKNNFALAASLLEMQKRREGNPQVAEGLEQAIARIHSFASAYANLAQAQGEGAVVAMDSYLLEVVDRVTRGAFHDNVVVDVEATPTVMPREVAVAIGLFTNEALTNCAKYAFPNGRAGKVAVRFSHDGKSWALDIRDDGVGNTPAAPAVPDGAGIGTRLLEAFARQAEADYEVDVSDKGRALRLSSAGNA